MLRTRDCWYCTAADRRDERGDVPEADLAAAVPVDEVEEPADHGAEPERTPQRQPGRLGGNECGHAATL